ncbi:phage minor head protein [Komagataeibacter xylinus]|uniref:phage head morphogenesis protein n=1 Tax=Komagataeibacter xylinus TaxID=28448 RepID=UPI00280AF346|nr:phage minor head protein [Komagataeibacter xylinus]
MADTIAQAAALPPSEALQYFRQKTNVPSATWDELWQETHARAFTVAGAASDAMLADFRKAVDRAISGGSTLKDFRQDFDGIVARYGWQHTGTPGWRSEIIYSTNIAMANSAGRYRRMTTPEAREMFPYWMYEHNACQHPRAEHVAWSGKVLRADDPWWNTHFPPNGWHCHCTVRLVSERMLRQNGWTVSEAPPVETRPWRNRRTGEVVDVPKGIDPGFAYNPGQAWARGQAAQVGLPGERFGPVLPPAQDAGAAHRPARAPVAPAEKTTATTTSIAAVARQKVQQRNVVQLLHKPVGTVEAGTVSAEISRELGTTTSSVLLSGATMEKQIRNHPDLTEADYRAVPEVLAHPVVIARSRTRHLMMFSWAGRLYRAVIKVTGDGKEIWLQSFHRTEPGKARAAASKLTFVKGSLADLEDDAPEGPPDNPP